MQIHLLDSTCYIAYSSQTFCYLNIKVSQPAQLKDYCYNWINGSRAAWSFEANCAMTSDAEDGLFIRSLWMLYHNTFVRINESNQSQPATFTPTKSVL